MCLDQAVSYGEHLFWISGWDFFLGRFQILQHLSAWKPLDRETRTSLCELWATLCNNLQGQLTYNYHQMNVNPFRWTRQWNLHQSQCHTVKDVMPKSIIYSCWETLTKFVTSICQYAKGAMASIVTATSSVMRLWTVNMVCRLFNAFIIYVLQTL